jgi:hypothetical protein
MKWAGSNNPSLAQICYNPKRRGKIQIFEFFFITKQPIRQNKLNMVKILNFVLQKGKVSIYVFLQKYLSPSKSSINMAT